MVEIVKKILIMLALVFTLCGNSEAQLSLKRDSVLADLRAQIFTPGIADSLVFRAMNRALHQVCNDFPAIAWVDTIVVAKTDFGVPVNADFSREYRVARKITSKGFEGWMPLKPISEDSIAGSVASEEQATVNPGDILSPEHYDIQGGLFYALPKDTRAADTFYVWYYANPPQIPSGVHPDSAHILGDTTLAGAPKMNVKFREKVIQYTIAQLYAMRALYNDAGWYLQFYGGNITPATKQQIGEK